MNYLRLHSLYGRKVRVLGSLSALTALESEAAERSNGETKSRSRLQKLQRQQRQIRRLEQKRDELLQQLQNASSSQSGLSRTARGGSAEDSERHSAFAYISELKEKLNVYKLTGVSVVKATQDSKTLCFTTSYHGVFHESYHLKLQRLNSGHFKVVHHDLPPFVLCSALPGSMEVNDTESAVRPLREALALYIIRRESLKGAEEKYKDVFQVTKRNSPLDYLLCRLNVNEEIQMEITLEYSDLSSLPTSARAVALRKGIRLTDQIPVEGLRKLQSFFCNNRLCAAIGLALDMLVAHFSAVVPRQEVVSTSQSAGEVDDSNS